MDTILHGISALQYLNAPPVARAFDMPSETIQALPLPVPDIAPRSNSPEAAKLLKKHLFGELKGIGLPVHLVVTGRATSCSEHIVWHETRYEYPPDDLIQIDDGLYVTSPFRTLLDIAPTISLVSLLRILFSMCGLYAICPSTSRMKVALEALVGRGALRPGVPSSIVAYHGADGVPLGMTDARGIPLPWEPCFDKADRLTDLWKRPPLITTEELLTRLDAAGERHGSSKLRRAGQLVLPGSASPAETLYAILAHLPRSLGGEGLPKPLLNRRVALNDAGARALGHKTCVGDATWLAARKDARAVCVEIEGAAFHGAVDGLGSIAWGRMTQRDDHARANALRASGFDVIPVTWKQMASLDAWEVLMDVIAGLLRVHRRVQTEAFKAQRARLRDELLGKPGLRRVGG